MNIESPARLSDAELLVQVKRLVQCERRATATLVAHLAEIEKRKLYLGQGCRSLFSYCTQVLHLSEHAAYNRIEAAKAAIRFPLILASLARGDVHLTAVKMLAPILTPENYRDLLDAAKHKSKREIEELVARVRPKPDAPDSMSKLPTSRPAEAPAANPEPLFAPAAASSAAAPATTAGRPAPTASAPPRPAVIVPLAPERYNVQFTASAATYDKLLRARALLRHQIPDGDLAEVFDRALDLLVRDLEKKKLAATDRPRRDRQATPGHSRHIPAEVKRAVWQRDQGRCAFVSPNGKRCTEVGQLEFDHVWPHGDGGPATVDNVRLLCARHNQYRAQEFFGLWHAEGVRESPQPYGRPGIRLL